MYSFGEKPVILESELHCNSEVIVHNEARKCSDENQRDLSI